LYFEYNFKNTIDNLNDDRPAYVNALEMMQEIISKD
jgi:hypothetical protein